MHCKTIIKSNKKITQSPSLSPPKGDDSTQTAIKLAFQKHHDRKLHLILTILCVFFLLLSSSSYFSEDKRFTNHHTILKWKLCRRDGWYSLLQWKSRKSAKTFSSIKHICIVIFKGMNEWKTTNKKETILCVCFIVLHKKSNKQI